MFKQGSLLLITVLLIAFILSGCGAPAATTTPESQLPTAEPVATTEPLPTPVSSEPKIATFIMWIDFIDLDPANAFTSEQVVMTQCYENLAYYNPPGSEELIRPGLATSWEANEDATAWTFYLRDGVTFQDGTEFNAEAVKANIDYYLSQGGAGCTFIWDAVEEVEVVDQHTVTFHLSYAAPIDLISTASYCGGMASPAALSQPKEWFDAGHCVGTGPYTIESFERGQRLVLTQFEDYWGGWQPNQFEKIVYEIVADPVVSLQMIEGGEADAYFSPLPDKVAGLQAKEDLDVYVRPSFQHMMFMLNTKKPPLDNKLVRQALAYSFPYEQFLERTEGLYTQSRGAIPEGMWGHGEELFQYSHDPEMAKGLLAEAGYSDGFELDLTYMSGYQAQAWAVELWTFALAELGIDLNARGMTFESLWELAKSDPETAQDITTFVWNPTWVTPYDPLYSMYHCEEQPFFNVSYYCNAEFDAMIDEANVLTGTNRESAEQMFIDAQELMIDDSPAVFVADIPGIRVLRADIEGFVDNPAYSNVIFWHEVTTTR